MIIITIIIIVFHCISFGFQHASYAAGAAFRGVRGGGAPPGGRGGPGGAESPGLRRGVRRPQPPKIVCAHNLGLNTEVVRFLSFLHHLLFF